MPAGQQWTCFPSRRRPKTHLGIGQCPLTPPTRKAQRQETSMSRYCSARFTQDQHLVGVPSRSPHGPCPRRRGAKRRRAQCHHFPPVRSPREDTALQPGAFPAQTALPDPAVDSAPLSGDQAGRQRVWPKSPSQQREAC